jgi:16S rRNA (uracil1498-N3)-methyltransferase
MSDRFYTADHLGPGEYLLTGAEAHHIATVRRFAAGDRITLFNGDGNEYAAEIVGASKKCVSLRILGSTAVDRELPVDVAIASALPKGDRAEFLVEKLTELGVTRFIPLVAERSVVVPKPSVVEKFTRIVIEASKQCGRNRLMVIDPPISWADLLKRTDLPRSRTVLHTSGTGSEMLRRETEPSIVAVGPEGGFTPGEIVAAVAVGWQTASLGSRILRVETAAFAAAAIIASGASPRSQ